MAEQRIVITIDNDGGITAKTRGIKGEACIDALDELLELDNSVVNLKKTDEFHQRQQGVEHVSDKLKRNR